MTISRVKPGNWGIGEKLASADLNALDVNVTNALDKRSGQTDTLASIVSASGAGRIIDTAVTGVDANTSYQAGGGNKIIRLTSAITAPRTYTLSATNAQTGDVIYVFAETSLSSSNDVIIKDQSSTTLFTAGNSASADGQWACFIYISGWRLFQRGSESRHRSQTFTANGNFTVPSGVYKLLLIGCGGGGGGGSANVGVLGNGTSYGSGGGGGGAALYSQIVAVTPGNVYAVTIGGGGTGGFTSGSPGNGDDGSDGGDTTFGSLATFRGAAGGGADVFGTTSTGFLYTLGGPPVRRNGGEGFYELYFIGAGATTGLLGRPYPRESGAGGAGVASRSAGIQPTIAGNPSLQGYAGGAAGAIGSQVGGYYGGGSGGGGGGGPYGVGANGGNGSNGNSAGGSSAATGGSNAGANTGAGGGGGGGSGNYQSGSAGSCGAGGNGGSGQLTVIWVK
jgi:hypothetical protein